MERVRILNYLQELRTKLDFPYELIFADREDFNKSIRKLGMRPIEIPDVLRSLEPEDYSEGPHQHFGGPLEYWVYGKEVKGIEIYIKIVVNTKRGIIICVSFHESIRPMTFPLRL